MRRPSARNYCGAAGKLDIVDVAGLGQRFAIQPKVDGCYAHVRLDHEGRVAQVTSRTGADISAARELYGILAGPPGSVFVGELEAHTERGNTAAHKRGWRQIHLFDAHRIGDRDVTAEPYQKRLDELWRAQSGLDLVNTLDGERQAGKLWRGSRGRWQAGPRDWRRLPIVPTLPPSRASELWDRALAEDIEGLVVVALDAPIGRRGAKRKVKPVYSLDCVVLEAGPKVAAVRTFGKTFVVACNGQALRPGNVVEVVHEGFYSDSTPRFARIAKRRTDLEAA